MVERLTLTRRQDRASVRAGVIGSLATFVICLMALAGHHHHDHGPVIHADGACLICGAPFTDDDLDVPLDAAAALPLASDGRAARKSGRRTGFVPQVLRRCMPRAPPF